MTDRISEYVECQKCKKLSGDDWSQCKGSCPKEDSPHYDLEAVQQFGPSKVVELTLAEAVKRDRWATFVEQDEDNNDYDDPFDQDLDEDEVPF